MILIKNAYDFNEAIYEAAYLIPVHSFGSKHDGRTVKLNK